MSRSGARKCKYPTKRAYATRAAAEETLRRIPNGRHTPGRVYKCRDHWHLTSHGPTWKR